MSVEMQDADGVAEERPSVVSLILPPVDMLDPATRRRRVTGSRAATYVPREAAPVTEPDTAAAAEPVPAAPEPVPPSPPAPAPEPEQPPVVDDFTSSASAVKTLNRQFFAPPEDLRPAPIDDQVLESGPDLQLRIYMREILEPWWTGEVGSTTALRRLCALRDSLNED